MSPSKKSVDSWLQRNTGLLRIVGIRLTSVQFVLNYLILGFDEKGALTTLVWPEVLNNSTRFTFGMDEYRNQLCFPIGHVVDRATIEQDETIRIWYDDGIEMRIPLRSYQG